MSKVIAYTDGASSHNQDANKRCGGWGVVLMLVDDAGEIDPRPQAQKELSGTVASATNNQMELEAVKQTLLAMKCADLIITIVTDSDYVIGVLSRHWKPKQNVVLIAEIKDLMTKHRISFEKVSGHSGVEYNDRADKLAVVASHVNT